MSVLRWWSRETSGVACRTVFAAWLAVAAGGCAGPSPAAQLDGGDASPAEDCSTAGDEDGNGLADCADPACAGAPACRATPGCGNGILDPGEECDDGNTRDGDTCESGCTLPRCGNGIVDVGEACDDGNTRDGDGCESSCTLPLCGNGTRDPGEACDDGNAANGDGCNARCVASTFAYVKASRTRFNDQLGTAIALSADGATLAVGSPLEDSDATGIDGDQDNIAAHDSGAVYVYVRSGVRWRQEAYVKASNTSADAQFGTSVALSADGSTLAVGAWSEASAATGVDGDQANRSAPAAGAVYVFSRANGAWHQQAYLKPSNTDAGDSFGLSVALSGSGDTLAIGAIGEASSATGTAGDESDNSAAGAGAVYVFARDGAVWHQQSYVKASNTGAGDMFGTTVALSADAATLAVGATAEASLAPGIDGDQSDNSALAAGAVYVLGRVDNTWVQQAYVKASNPSRADDFGQSVALSGDGNTLVVGSPGEDGAACGIDGDQAKQTLFEAGAAYVFARKLSTWSQQAYIKASNARLTAQVGWSLALSPDGSALAVGATTEDSASIGIGGDQANADGFASGAVYMFRRKDADWWQQAYIKASNTEVAAEFGWSVALAADGTLAVGAPGESSAATGVDGDQHDESLSGAGAVYIVQ